MTARSKLLWCLLPFCLFSTVSALATALLPTREEALTMVSEKRFDELEQLAGGLRHEKLEFYRELLPPLRQFYNSLQPTREADDTTWTNHIALLNQWAAAYPDSPTPLVALGGSYKSYAWKARGDAYGRTVSRENLKIFNERLARAREALEKADGLPIKDPETYFQLLDVAAGLGLRRPEMEAIFSKGIALEPNYTSLYGAKAHYLLPQWKGKPGEWEAFAEASANARGGDEGDMLYMIIARSQTATFGDDLFNRTKLSYRRIQRGFEASLTRQPDNMRERNSYCHFACMWGDQDQAKRLFKQINGKCETNVWGDEARFQQWQNWALHNGPSPLNPVPGVTVVSSIREGPNPVTILMIGGGIILGGTAFLALIIWNRALQYRKQR